MHRTLEEDTAKPAELWLGSINAGLDGALDTQVALLARSLARVFYIRVPHRKTSSDAHLEAARSLFPAKRRFAPVMRLRPDLKP